MDDTYFLHHAVITCPTLENPTNGRVRVSGQTVGSRAIYSCNPGYKIDGNSRRRCMDDGQWSGEDPRCVRTLAHSYTR